MTTPARPSGDPPVLMGIDLADGPDHTVAWHPLEGARPMTTPRPDPACRCGHPASDHDEGDWTCQRDDCECEEYTPLPDALTAGERLLERMQEYADRYGATAFAGGVWRDFVSGALPGIVKEARADAEREVAALREALVCIARPLGSGAYHGDPKDWRALSVWMVGIARAALAKLEGSDR